MSKEEIDWDLVYERNKRSWLGLDENDNPIDEKELTTSHHEEKEICYLKDIPFLPKNLGTPKNCIPEWYARRHKDLEFKSNDCFFLWNDKAEKAHNLHHTCIFKCPLTGELFGCGQFGEDKSKYKITEESINTGDDDNGEGEKVKIVWHRKKKDAEHAAAARALDCLSYREGGGSKSYGLCEEDPYMEDDECKFKVPSSVPSEFHDWLENNVVTQIEARPLGMEVDEEKE